MKNYRTVKDVVKGSIADEVGIARGDTVNKINGQQPQDILEYKYLIADDFIELEILKADGSEEIIEIENPDYEDLGIEFNYPLLTRSKSCSNKCIFCFIDQLPKGMRKTMYFKDDDSRLSFLQGNYVTLTNMTDAEIAQLIRLRLSPVNVSVHTTDPELRVFMTGNKRAGELYNILKTLAEADIMLNCQIVTCPGVNDGEELDKTLADLGALFPQVHSVSVVPVGLTSHRGGLFSIKPYEKENAISLIKQVAYWQGRFLREHGTRLVYIADELYIKARLPIPLYEEYEDFPQIENGVGLIAGIQKEFEEKINKELLSSLSRSISIATGVAAYKFILDMANTLQGLIKGLKINVYAIENRFFGETVTVAGLICGVDLIEQLRDKELGEQLLIPTVMLRSDGDIMLDDTTIVDIERELGTSVLAVMPTGYELFDSIIGGKA